MISDDIVRPVAFLSDFLHIRAASVFCHPNVKFSKNAFHCIFLMKYPYCAVFLRHCLQVIHIDDFILNFTARCLDDNHVVNLFTDQAAGNRGVH